MNLDIWYFPIPITLCMTVTLILCQLWTFHHSVKEEYLFIHEPPPLFQRLKFTNPKSVLLIKCKLSKRENFEFVKFTLRIENNFHSIQRVKFLGVWVGKSLCGRAARKLRSTISQKEMLSSHWRCFACPRFWQKPQNYLQNPPNRKAKLAANENKESATFKLKKKILRIKATI